MQYASAIWWILFAFIVVFLILLILLLTGSNFQLVQNLDTNPTVALGASAQSVLFQPTSSTNVNFVFRPRSQGTMIRLWNNSTQDIVLLNDLLNSLSDTVQIGTSSAGVFPANKTTLCINMNGVSQGSGLTGSWRCTAPEDF